jgi:D-alanyl-D-alanine dipeptidase
MRSATTILLLATLMACSNKDSTTESKTHTSPLENPAKFVELKEDPYVLDIRYATMNNFADTIMYPCPKCFLRPEVAIRLDSARKVFEEKGYRIKLYDCYRPLDVQWAFWKKVPDERYVAHPLKGSMHNRGLAVDLTLVDKDGNELDMGTDYDYFGEEAYHHYTNHSDTVLANRKLLLETLTSLGFEPYPTEWWHYSYIEEGKTWKVHDQLWSCN